MLPIENSVPKFHKDRAVFFLEFHLQTDKLEPLSKYSIL